MGDTSASTSPSWIEYLRMPVSEEDKGGGNVAIHPINQSQEASSAKYHDKYFNKKDDDDSGDVAVVDLLLIIDGSANNTP